MSSAKSLSLSLSLCLNVSLFLFLFIVFVVFMAGIDAVQISVANRDCPSSPPAARLSLSIHKQIAPDQPGTSELPYLQEQQAELDLSFLNFSERLPPLVSFSWDWAAFCSSLFTNTLPPLISALSRAGALALCSLGVREGVCACLSP